MKKYFVLFCLLMLLLVSCEKYCTCTNPNTVSLTEIEISPEENCSDYSNSTIGNCE